MRISFFPKMGQNNNNIKMLNDLSFMRAVGYDDIEMYN